MVSSQLALPESILNQGVGKDIVSHAEPLGSLLGGRMLDVRGQKFSLRSKPNSNCIKSDHICYFQEYSGAGRRPK